MTIVRQHERKSPAKSAEYIATHMALMTRAEQRIAFARRHGVVVDENSEADHSADRKSIIGRFMPWFGRRA
ncbi:hypothetical protein [Rhizobium gallicum]|uniref:hypothetical protein n=1 Tax=Rhizobium gallicum TaxID=56730 RepID=UPI000374A33A